MTLSSLGAVPAVSETSRRLHERLLRDLKESLGGRLDTQQGPFIKIPTAISMTCKVGIMWTMKSHCSSLACDVVKLSTTL
jgi:hypothetical protein